MTQCEVSIAALLPPRTYDEAMWTSAGNKQRWNAKVVHDVDVFQTFATYVVERLSTFKWRNWKDAPDLARVRPAAEAAGVKTHQSFPNLKADRDVCVKNTWIAEPTMKILGEFEASLQKYPTVTARHARGSALRCAYSPARAAISTSPRDRGN